MSFTVDPASLRPAHPLHGAGRRGVPAAVVILIIWLAHLGWSAEQIVPILAVATPAAVAGASRNQS